MKTSFYIMSCMLILISVELSGQESLDRELKQVINYNIKSIDSLLIKADSLSNSKNYEEAEKAYRSIFELAQKKQQKKLILDAGFKLERFLSETMEKYEESKEVIIFLNEYCDQLDDKDCQIKSIFRLGELYQIKGEFIKALEYFSEAVLRAENSENSYLRWKTRTLRGFLLGEIGDQDNAKKDFEKALNYLTEEDSDSYRSTSYINIASSFSDKKPDSIIYYSKLSAKYCNNNKSSRNCYIAYNNIAWSYLLKGKPKKALELINANIDIDNMQFSYRDNLYAGVMHTIGAINYELGNYKESLEYFEIANTYFEKKRTIVNSIIVKEDLSKAYEKTGDLRSSIKALREIIPLFSKMDSLKITREIARIESKKILNIKDEKISDLKQENVKIEKKVNKTRWVIYFLGPFLIIIISILLYRGHKNALRFHRINEELSLSRLKSLRSMMNPHFLFNSFSTLQNYILKKDNLRANEYMTELSNLIRNVLSSSDSIFINFEEELQILKSYITIEQERFGKNFEIKYQIDDELIRMNPTIPSMVVQPYIENALIHGFSHSDKKGILVLSFEKEEDTLLCKVIDNGIGRGEAERLQKKGNDKMHLSIATRNTNERLRILSEIINQKASVVIRDLFEPSGVSKGTEVIITLPLMKTKMNE
ncbi:tetratricopeptide repeat protein [Aquimarina sp. MAR_2010_214]|uniref:histidine kinase n=1 Tax=Aquimarina sp. MAR_2010_214 TaxID=1250026 RepID=UPI000C70F421|nr:histidine kinase [Aquimarina sp. MAR_2010_214]PKV49032.1 tetratricopeptide repeat protein [Aquimarina sp. MAR_2010_214]